MNMKILVTGGSGFLGRNLIARLRRDGHEVTCLDRFEAPFLRELGVTFRQGDVYERVAVEEAVEGVDAVFHLACTTIPKTSNDDPHFDVMSNIGGTLMLLDAAVRYRVARVVFISSGGTVYGKPLSVPIREDHPLHPECSYGITKGTIEKYLRLYHDLKGLSTCSLRLANPYGEFQRFKAVQGVIPVICYKMLVGEEMEIWGDGSVVRDFIYVGDAVEAMVKALDRREVCGEINIGGGGGHSLNEIMDVAECVSGLSLNRRYTPARAFDVPMNVLDVSRAAEKLDWRPRVPLDVGIAHTLDWIREQIHNQEKK